MMLKEKFESLKFKFRKALAENNKRRIENLVVFLILLIVTIISINLIWGNKKGKDKNNSINPSYKKLAQSTNDIVINSNNIGTNEYNLKQSLEDILSNISGVGKVKALITYSETSEVVAMYNEKSTSNNTEEADKSGGTRKIEESDLSKELVFEDVNGGKVPITQKVIMPKIEGAIIAAEGAGNADIKANIIQAVSAATGLATYRIQVFEMSKEN